ncbi:MAG TPA: hypothetical protein VEB22_03780 [Phycisphaerales bacterium]|nr:hypothetical protein [Phycisphaerales bacterium]
MFAKLCVLIISAGLLACTLLALRQQRIEAVHQMAKVNLRIMEADRGLARLRTEIAANLEPKRIEELASKLGTLRAIELAPTRPGTMPAGRQPAFAHNTRRTAAAPTPDDRAYGGGVNTGR